MKVADLAGHKVMIAVSGGLDSCTITHWLKEKGKKEAELEKIKSTSIEDMWLSELDELNTEYCNYYN